MPLVATSTTLATARLQAKDAVRAKWAAMNRVLSKAEINQARLEMEEADSAAIAAWITANAVVVVVGPGGGGTGGVT